IGKTDVDALSPCQPEGVGLDAIAEDHELVGLSNQAEPLPLPKLSFRERGARRRRRPGLPYEPGEPRLTRRRQTKSAVALQPHRPAPAGRSGPSSHQHTRRRLTFAITDWGL